MSKPNYEIPNYLVGLDSEQKFCRWLQRKAQALVTRDRQRGNQIATVAVYKEAIHEAITRDGPNDWYTGELLDWSLIDTYDNDASRRGGRVEKHRFAQLPTIDHEEKGLGNPRFRICGWAVNDAKNDLHL